MLSFFAPRNRKMWKRNGAARIKPRGKAHTAHRRKNFVGMTEKTQNILSFSQKKPCNTRAGVIQYHSAAIGLCVKTSVQAAICVDAGGCCRAQTGRFFRGVCPILEPGERITDSKGIRSVQGKLLAAHRTNVQFNLLEGSGLNC